ncbi:MAG TPA: ester cyclase [Flavisolibacter sp.]|nr:ester cyclase [Flavisolibacter sp.]
MKKILFAVAASFGCFLIACNNTGNSGNDKNISTSREIYNGIETGDTTKLSAIAPDALDHAGPYGDVTSGDSIKGMLAQIHNHIRDLKIEIINDVANSDYVYTWNKWTGTALDSSMGFTPNQPINTTGVDIVRFRDGKVVEHWGFVDQKDVIEMRAQMMPNATTVKVTMGDTSANKKDTTKK